MGMIKNQIVNKALSASRIVAPKFFVSPQDLAKFLTAITYVESTFNPLAMNNNSTARGVTQVLINTQRWIEKKLKVAFAPAMYKASKYPEAEVTPYKEDDRMFDPDYALLIGGWYLAYNYNRYNDWNKAIVAYHLGSYDRSNKDGKVYLSKVLKAFDELNLGKPIKRSITRTFPIKVLDLGSTKYFYRHYI